MKAGFDQLCSAIEGHLQHPQDYLRVEDGGGLVLPQLEGDHAQPVAPGLVGGPGQPVTDRHSLSPTSSQGSVVGEVATRLRLVCATQSPWPSS